MLFEPSIKRERGFKLFKTIKFGITSGFKLALASVIAGYVLNFSSLLTIPFLYVPRDTIDEYLAHREEISDVLRIENYKFTDNHYTNIGMIIEELHNSFTYGNSSGYENFISDKSGKCIDSTLAVVTAYINAVTQGYVKADFDTINVAIGRVDSSQSDSEEIETYRHSWIEFDDGHYVESLFPPREDQLEDNSFMVQESNVDHYYVPYVHIIISTNGKYKVKYDISNLINHYNVYREIFSVIDQQFETHLWESMSDIPSPILSLALLSPIVLPFILFKYKKKCELEPDYTESPPQKEPLDLQEDNTEPVLYVHTVISKNDDPEVNYDPAFLISYCNLYKEILFAIEQQFENDLCENESEIPSSVLSLYVLNSVLLSSLLFNYRIKCELEQH